MHSPVTDDYTALPDRSDSSAVSDSGFWESDSIDLPEDLPETADLSHDLQAKNEQLLKQEQEQDQSTVPPPSSEADLARLATLIGLDEGDPEFIEVFLEEACGELSRIRDHLALWRADLANRDVLTIMRRAFHTLKGSGRMVGATLIGDFAWEFEELLNQVLSEALPASPAVVEAVAAAATALEPLVGMRPLGDSQAVLALLPELVEQARALRAGAVQPEPASAANLGFETGVDAEFVQVFLEEARGELGVIREQQALWQRNPRDRHPVAILRRAFHTLKGSGRVVGAVAIGDMAERFENLLNTILNGERTADPTVVALVGETAQALAPLIGEAPGGQSQQALATVERLSARAAAWLSETPDDDLITLPDLPESAPISLRPSFRPSTRPLEQPPSLRPSFRPSVRPVELEPPPLALPSAPPAPPPVPVASVSPAPAPAPAVMVPPGVDAELAQIFQYEAVELLDASDMILQQLGVEPSQPGLWNDLRRSLHTLKGSGRLAGFMTVGDLAHAAEAVLDALSKHGESGTAPGVMEALQQTLDRLNQMLVESASGQHPEPATTLITELHQLAARIAAHRLVEGGLPPVVAPEVVTVGVEPRSKRVMTELDQELAQVFQAEAAEVLDSSDLILRQLRTEPENTDLLNNLRREMHTLKGGSRMTGYIAVGDLAHSTESVLDALGRGVVTSSSEVLDTLQRSLDTLYQMLGEVRDGSQPTAAPPELLQLLQRTAGLEVAEPSSMVALPVRPILQPAAVTPTRTAPSAAPSDGIRVSAALLTTLVNQMGESSIFRARIDQGVGAMSLNLHELEQTIARLRRQVNQLANQAETRIQSRQDQNAKLHQLEFDPLELDRFTELQQVARSLMEIADDLGNVGNTLDEHARDIGTLLDQQGKVNKEIQQGLMHTGMVRFGGIIPRLRRVVRQSAQELGKRAELLVSGEEAEVDRTVLESMVAPLEHMLRNSLAHGIEAPEQRRAAGKPEIGAISLGLRREGAELVLELNDDGGGLNFAAIRTKGEEKGLLTADQNPSQEELIALLLRPGFSTATSVTQISGRGVGMDVVNEAIRAMRGALLVQTEPGQGTRFTIRLPFSLSVTQALLARAGDSLFAIPLLSIERVTRLTEDQFKHYLSGEAAQFEYAQHQYPIHNLGILAGSQQLAPFDEAPDRHPPALLFRSAEASAALQVESVLGNQEIIVKPIGMQFNGVPGISGVTVLGDGQVVVVLELAALVRHIGSQLQKQTEIRALRAARQEERTDRLTVMVIDDSITMRKVTSRILERRNVRVITAKDGLDAVAMLQTEVPDLAILDIEMPRMDGFEVLAHIRNQPNLAHLPVIMVTSRGGDKHRDRAVRLGVTDYLTKPYQEEQLISSIRRILGVRAQQLMLGT